MNLCHLCLSLDIVVVITLVPMEMHVLQELPEAPILSVKMTPEQLQEICCGYKLASREALVLKQF